MRQIKHNIGRKSEADPGDGSATATIYVSPFFYIYLVSHVHTEQQLSFRFDIRRNYVNFVRQSQSHIRAYIFERQPRRFLLTTLIIGL